MDDLSALDRALTAADAPITVQQLTDDLRAGNETLRAVICGPPGYGKSTYACEMAKHMLKTEFVANAIVLHGPPQCTRIWTALEHPNVKTYRLSEDLLAKVYKHCSERNKATRKHTLIVMDDPIGAVATNSAALNMCVFSGREHGISVLFVTHRFSHEITPAIRGALDLVIVPSLNDDTAKLITGSTTLGISLTARKLKEWVCAVAQVKHVFAVLYRHDQRRVLSPVDINDDSRSVARSEGDDEEDAEKEEEEDSRPARRGRRDSLSRKDKTDDTAKVEVARLQELLHRTRLSCVDIREFAESLGGELVEEAKGDKVVTLSRELVDGLVAYLSYVSSEIGPDGSMAFRGPFDRLAFKPGEFLRVRQRLFRKEGVRFEDGGEEEAWWET